MSESSMTGPGVPTDTNGWFEWDLKVTPGRAQEIRVELGGRNRSTLEVFADGEKLQGDSGTAPGEAGARTQTYALSPELVGKKEKIKLKFQAPADQRGANVATVRVVTPATEK